MRACLLPYGRRLQEPRAPKTAPELFLGARKLFFGAVFLDYIKQVIALQVSLDYKSQPITGKSPEESSYRQNHGRVIVTVIAKSKTTEQDHSLVYTVWVYAVIKLILLLYSGVGSLNRVARPSCLHRVTPKKHKGLQYKSISIMSRTMADQCHITMVFAASMCRRRQC